MRRATGLGRAMKSGRSSGIVDDRGQPVEGDSSGHAFPELEEGRGVPFARAVAGPGREDLEPAVRGVQAQDGGVVGVDEAPRLLGRLDEEGTQVAQRGRLESQVVEDGHLAGQPLGRGHALRLLDGDGHLAGDGGEEVELFLGERRGREPHDLEHAQGLAARAHGDGELAEPLAIGALEGRGAAERPAEPRGVDGQVRRPLARRRLQAQAIAFRLHAVEGHAVVAEVGPRAVDGQNDEVGPPSHCRHVPHQRGHALEPARMAPLRVEDAPAAQERRRGSGEDAEELRVGLGEAARLVDGHDQPEHLALRNHRHEHDRIRPRRLHDLLDEARVLARAVAQVRPSGTEVPEGAVFGADHVSDPLGDVVGHAVHGERRRHRVGDRLVQHDQADGRADQPGQTLRHHAVEGFRLRDQRPVAADLVKDGQRARALLGLAAAAVALVVQRLEPEEGPHLEDEVRGVDGLLQEVVGSRVVALAHGRGVAERGQDDDGDGRTVDLADARARLEAVEARHAHVEQHEVVGALPQHLEGGLARLRPRALEPVLGEEVEQAAGDVGIVVDDEDAGGGRCAGADVVGPREGHRKVGGPHVGHRAGPVPAKTRPISGQGGLAASEV